MNSRGPWIQTYTGKKFFPLNPRPEEVCIEDIAHALSMSCRYTGHTTEFYSVAEHSILASHFVPPALALEGLLHDAAEAYIGDMASPLKSVMPSFRVLEDGILAVVGERFGARFLRGKLPDEVKQIDYRLLADEQANLMPEADVEGWFPSGKPEPLGAVIDCHAPSLAKRIFLLRYDQVRRA